MLSKACSYGLRATILLAMRGEDSFTTIRDLSETLGISFHFLTKILQMLTDAGLLESQKGPKGGVALARPASRTTVYDIVTAIDGVGLFTECILGLPGCGSRRPCPLHTAWESERSRLQTMMRRHTVAELADGVERLDLRLSDIA